MVLRRVLSSFQHGWQLLRPPYQHGSPDSLWRWELGREEERRWHTVVPWCWWPRQSHQDSSSQGLTDVCVWPAPAAKRRKTVSLMRWDWYMLRWQRAWIVKVIAQHPKKFPGAAHWRWWCPFKSRQEYVGKCSCGILLWLPVWSSYEEIDTGKCGSKFAAPNCGAQVELQYTGQYCHQYPPPPSTMLRHQWK